MFEKATLSDCSVSAGVISEFLDKIEPYVNNHSIVIIKDDKLVLEHYHAPFAAEYPHSMFSVSKGFTSTAVGYAVEDGLIKLDDNILDYYPEYAADAKRDPRNGKVTVRQLLTMSSGKKCNFARDLSKTDYADDWVKYKFRGDNDFCYSNDDVYVLAKAVSRLYGKSVLDLLDERLFQPLGIEKPFWETNANGYVSAATGLYLKSMDLAKVAYCYLKGGKMNDKQVIPKYWTEVASQYYVDLPPYYRSSKGYGFYFWGDPFGGFRFDGMYGQFGVIFPKHNAVLVLTDLTCNTPELIDAIFDYFPRAFESDCSPEQDSALQARLASCETYVAKTTPRNFDIEKRVSGNTYNLKAGWKRIYDKLGFPQGMICTPINCSFAKRPSATFDDFRFDFDSTGFDFSWREAEDTNKIRVNMDGTLGKSRAILSGYPFDMLGEAYWEGNVLNIYVWAINTPSKRLFRITFEKDGLKMFTDSVPSFREFAVGNMEEVLPKPKNKVGAALYDGFCEFVFKFTTPTYKCKKA